MRPEVMWTSNSSHTCIETLLNDARAYHLNILITGCFLCLGNGTFNAVGYKRKAKPAVSFGIFFRKRMSQDKMGV